MPREALRIATSTGKWVAARRVRLPLAVRPMLRVWFKDDVVTVSARRMPRASNSAAHAPTPGGHWGLARAPVSVAPDGTPLPATPAEQRRGTIAILAARNRCEQSCEHLVSHTYASCVV